MKYIINYFNNETLLHMMPVIFLFVGFDNRSSNYPLLYLLRFTSMLFKIMYRFAYRVNIIHSYFVQNWKRVSLDRNLLPLIDKTNILFVSWIEHGRSFLNNLKRKLLQYAAYYPKGHIKQIIKNVLRPTLPAGVWTKVFNGF